MNIIYAGNQGGKGIKVASNKKSALEFLLSNSYHNKEFEKIELMKKFVEEELLTDLE